MEEILNQPSPPKPVVVRDNGSIKILVVDDDVNLRETLCELLDMEGYRVVQAATGKECVEIVTREFFNIILMDYNLPDDTGVELIKKIRAVNFESQIIMVTAYASLNTMIKAMHEAVYDFLIKPVDFDYLKRTIARALDKYYLERDNRELLIKLQENNAELTRLDNMKSRFFSIVSHDLSNSLMGLKMSFDMFQKRLALDEEQQKKLGYMQESVEQMSHLIKDLVDWAAIENGKLRIEPKKINISKIAQNTLETFRDKAKIVKGLQMGFNGPEEMYVMADEKRVKQVLNNLLENAVRHTDSGGRIDVTVAKVDEKDVKISVTDTGDGILPGMAAGLFESFSQNGEKGRVGRLGLGLSISKEIVQSHGGAIWASSEGRGLGATFQFTLPEAD